MRHRSDRAAWTHDGVVYLLQPRSDVRLHQLPVLSALALQLYLQLGNDEPPHARLSALRSARAECCGRASRAVRSCGAMPRASCFRSSLASRPRSTSALAPFEGCTLLPRATADAACTSRLGIASCRRGRGADRERRVQQSRAVGSLPKQRRRAEGAVNLKQRLQ